MRLLTLDSAGEFSLTDDLIDDIPRYAILSHTWRLDGDEVTFEDLQNSSAKDKAGYDKIRFCGEQAKRDGLQYFWVDTCCIQKSSSAELQEAITSMFEWYAKAVKCYVYLADVSISTRDNVRTTQLAFQNSRWFRRGWTLQELLAPRVVEFYSLEGELLGDKIALEQQIHETTGIPFDALRGAPLRDFSQNERLRWAEKRETKKKEDKAYCLLGILGVFMYLNYGEGDNAFIRLKEEIRKSSTHQSSKPVWYVPFNKMSGFVGRADEIRAVRTRLFGRDDVPIISLLGLGGMGKSRLALELAYQVKFEHPQRSVFWVRAETLLTFEEDMLQIGKKLDIPSIDDAKADIKALVKQRLEKQTGEKWFLILDNADDEAIWGRRSDPIQQKVSLVDYLPRTPNGATLVTTRSRLVATFLSGKDVVDLQAPSANEAVEMFSKRLGHLALATDPMAIETLLEKLTYLPLAIVQASSFINQIQCSVQDYLELLDQPEDNVIELLSKDFGDQSRYPNALNPVATTWLISFKHIREHHPLAVAFLSAMACLHEKAIPSSLLPETTSKIETIEAIGVLTGYSFAEKRASSDGVSDIEQLYDVHRLVQLAARSWLKMENKLANEIKSCIVRLMKLFPTREHKHKGIWSMYLPHGQRLCESGGDFIELYDLLGIMGEFFLVVGKYNEAVRAYTAILDWKEKRFDSSDEQILETYNDLGRALNCTGDYPLAQQYLQRALEGYKILFGTESVLTVISMSHLATTYRNQGRWAQAEELQVQVLEMSTRMFGAEHPNTLIYMSNLALTYGNQGRWVQAEELQVQQTEASTRVFGKEHPNTLISMANLATTYWNQGRWTEAEELEVQIMEASTRVLGAEHPNTLTAKANLASTYSKQGRYTQAEELEVPIMETRKKILGAEHPDTLLIMTNLASTYRKQGRWTQAEELITAVIETSEQVLGAEHPNTLSGMTVLVSTYRSQGILTQAEELGLHVLDTRTRVLGAEHPFTLTSMYELALVYMSQERKGDAITLLHSCGNLRSKILGPSHPQTEAVMEMLQAWEGDSVGLGWRLAQNTGQMPGAWVD